MRNGKGNSCFAAPQVREFDLLLFVGGQDRDMAMIGQAFGMGRLENGSSVALVFGYGNQYINFVIFHKSINRFEKVVFSDEIELSIELAEHAGQFFLSFL